MFGVIAHTNLWGMVLIGDGAASVDNDRFF